MEEEVKKWLKKRQQELQKKEPPAIKISGESEPKKPAQEIKKESEVPQPEITTPVREEQSIIYAPAEELPETPFTEKPELIRKKEIPAIVTTKKQLSTTLKKQVVEKLSELRFRIDNKTLKVTVVLGAIIILGSFSILFFPKLFSVTPLVNFTQSFNEGNKYMISLTHLGNSISNSTDLPAITFGIEIYNQSSLCPIDYHVLSQPQTNYSFYSKTSIRDKNLGYYENSNFVFDVYVGRNSNKFLLNFTTSFVNKDSFDPMLIFNELPKLNQNFSINFDLPFFNQTSFNEMKNSSENKIFLHAELSDDWNRNATFLCRLIRSYDAATDNRLSSCSTQISLFEHKNTQCIEGLLNECGIPTQVRYVVEASHQGRNIDCTIPSTDLTSNKKYQAQILIFVPYSKNLFISHIIKPSAFSSFSS